MTGNAERQRQVPEYVPCDESGDEDCCDGEVGNDDATCPACQRDHGGDGGEFVSDGYGVGGFQRQVGSATSHGYRGVCGRHCGGVIDAVTYKKHAVALGL